MTSQWLSWSVSSAVRASAQPKGADGLRRVGYSRDKRSDCVQVVIALIVTPEGFPLAHEVLPGNTTDKSTLRDFCRRSKRSMAGRAACG